MSIGKAAGRRTLFALVVYLFVKGALIVVPRNMVAAISALVAALVHVCCGAGEAASLQQQSAVAAREMAPIHGSEFAVETGAVSTVHPTKEP